MTEKKEIKEEIKDESFDKIKEDQNLKDYEIKTSDDILNIDFSSDDEVNLDEAYEFVKVSKKPKETKELVEKREADNIIKNSSSKYLDPDYINTMNKEHENLKNMLRKYDVNKDVVKKLTEVEKDKIYALAEYLFNEFQKKLNNMNFYFPLTMDEWKFMFDVLYNKIEYDQNEIFQLKEVREKYLDNVKDSVKELQNNENEISTIVNVNDLIIIYHLISKYKVKGVNKSHYSYLNLLTKIGERIKLFNAYNTWIQRLSNDFQSWGSSLTVDEETIKGTVPKKPEKENK